MRREIIANYDFFHVMLYVLVIIYNPGVGKGSVIQHRECSNLIYAWKTSDCDIKNDYTDSVIRVSFDC